MTNLNTPAGNMEPHRGTLILVFGILGLVVCFIFGICAWVMGKADLEKMRTGMMDPEGESLTKVGYILGIVGVGLFCLAIVFTLLWTVVFGVAAAASS